MSVNNDNTLYVVAVVLVVGGFALAGVGVPHDIVIMILVFAAILSLVMFPGDKDQRVLMLLIILALGFLLLTGCGGDSRDDYFPTDRENLEYTYFEIDGMPCYWVEKLHSARKAGAVCNEDMWPVTEGR